MSAFLRAMEQDPQDRFQSAEEMQQAILAGGSATGFYPSRAYSTTTASTPTIQRQAPSPVAPPRETFTPAITTFERQVLPLVVDIGSSIYRALKEQKAGTQARMRNAASMEQPPVYMRSPASLSPAPSPSPPPPAVPSYEAWTHRLFREIGALLAELLAVVMTIIYHLLGVASAIISLLLIARFVLTFFHLSLGDFSSWVNLLSTPLVAPFGNWLIHTSSTIVHTVDVSTVIAFLVYAVGFALLRGLLKPFRSEQQWSGL